MAVRFHLTQPEEIEGVCFQMRYCHAVRSHPETRIPGDINYGSLHKWEKRQIAKVNRRYARSLIKKEVMTYVTEQIDYSNGCVAQ